MKFSRTLTIICAVLLAMTTGGCGLWWIPGEAGEGDVVNNTPPDAQPEEAAVQEMINCLAVNAMLNGWRDCPVLCDGDLRVAEVWLGTSAVVNWRLPVEEDLAAGPVMRLSGGVADGVLALTLTGADGPLWEHSIRLLP